MGRQPRTDQPGRLHHVMNRAIARRTLFENDSDIRFFLSRVAREVRAGHVKVHAFCVMTTHFHLLLESVSGQLSASVRRISNAYSRWFNRTRLRDGPLFRGRFHSFVVDTREYYDTLLRYIHDNPVSAGLVGHASAYVWSSAWWRSQERQPLWLAGARPRCSSPLSGLAALLPAAAKDSSPERDRQWQRWTEANACEDLLGMASIGTLEWMERKAQLADGTRPGAWRLDAQRVRSSVEAFRIGNPLWVAVPERKRTDGWRLALSAALRELCGTTYAQAAEILSRSTTEIFRDCERHHIARQQDEKYARAYGELLEKVRRAARSGGGAGQAGG